MYNTVFMSTQSPSNQTEAVPEKLEVRKLSAIDAERYNELRLEALSKNPKSFAYSFEEARQLTLPEIQQQLASGTIIGVFAGDSLVGSVTLWKGNLSKMNHKGEVHEMYVDENKRSRGIVRKLLEALFAEAEAQEIQELQLIVWTENASALKLYTSMGFKVWGTERNALQVPDGGYINEYHMARKIGNAAEKPVDDKVTSWVTETHADLATAAKIEHMSMLSENGFLEAFKDRENRNESEMQDAVLQLHDMISENPQYASLWENVWKRAGHMNKYTIADITGGTIYADRMANYATGHLKEIFTRSTFSHMGTPYQVKICLEDAARGGHSSLPELARHIRSALETKILQNAARHIDKERERRLAAAFGLRSPHQLTSSHRHQYLKSGIVTPAQLEAYYNGDRSENVFGIGKWTRSDIDEGHLPIAQ